MSNLFSILDIGARGGFHRSYENFPHKFNYFQFEPDPVENLRLSSQASHNFLNFLISPFAISNKIGPNTLYLYDDPSLSSLYELDMDVAYRHKHVKLSNKLEVNTTTLDYFVQSQNIKPLFLTIDAQGQSYDILESGSKTLSNFIQGLRVEVEFQKIYKNQKLFPEIDQLLRSLGFILVRFERPGPGTAGISTDMNLFSTDESDGLPVWADALYIKDQSFCLNNDSTFIYTISWLFCNNCSYMALELIYKLGLTSFINLLSKIDSQESIKFSQIILSFLQKVNTNDVNFLKIRSGYNESREFIKQLIFYFDSV